MGKFFSNFYVTAGTSNSVERVWLGWCASMLPHHRTALRKYKYRQTAFLLEGKKKILWSFSISISASILHAANYSTLFLKISIPKDIPQSSQVMMEAIIHDHNTCNEGV